MTTAFHQRFIGGSLATKTAARLNGVEKDLGRMIDFERAVTLLKEAAKTEVFESRRGNSKSERVRKLRAGVAALRAKNATWAQIAQRVSAVLGEGISMDTVRKSMVDVDRAGQSPNRPRAGTPTIEPTAATARTQGAQPAQLPTNGDATFGAAGRRF